MFAGFLVTNFLGRKIFEFTEILLQKIPMIKSIYTIFKQVADTSLGKRGQGFRRPILLEYPRKGVWTIGLMTGITKGEIQELTKQEVINVFIPTTPNPTSGFYIVVPRTEVTLLAMSVEDAFKLIISGGIVAPETKDQLPGQ